LFQLEAEEETAMRDQARAALAEAEGRLANLLKGRRQAELDGIAARKAQAEAQVRLAKQQLTRQQRLAESPAFSPEQLDQARANYDLQKARVDELTAELADAQAALGRDDEVAAARAAVQQQQAGLAQAEWRLGQRRRVAPAAGLVADTYFNPGETVGAGQPVVSILPPENRKVRFFVPETLLATLPVGAAVTIRCDGCGEGLAATVRFVAAEAEYTPPVLYNRDNRNRLLYLMEAWPAAAAAERLRPGQPVDVLPRAP
jgi:HlyD family secretion protein